MSEGSSARQSSGGFTLLELLIALAIFGLVVAILTSGVRFSGRAWDAQERHLDRQDDLAALQNSLRSLIASGRDFKGGPDSLEFVATMPRALNISGLFDIELATVDERLVISWRPHLRPGATPQPMTQTELARGIAGLDLRYFVMDDKHQSGGWSGSLGAKQTPKLVEVVVLLPEADQRSWPPLVIAPMIEAGPA